MLHENLRNIRLSEGLTQEEMAEKLGYSYNGYAKVERGEAIPKGNTLKRIADILKTDLQKLMATHDINNVINITGNCHYGSQNVILLTESQCAHELEKAQLLLQEKDKEIEHLKTENSLLREVIELMKTQQKPQE